jgi:hypothetical protein
METLNIDGIEVTCEWNEERQGYLYHAASLDYYRLFYQKLEVGTEWYDNFKEELRNKYGKLVLEEKKNGNT